MLLILDGRRYEGTAGLSSICRIDDVVSLCSALVYGSSWWSSLYLFVQVYLRTLVSWSILLAKSQSFVTDAALLWDVAASLIKSHFSLCSWWVASTSHPSSRIVVRSFVLLSQRSDRLCHPLFEWSLQNHDKFRCLSPPVKSSLIIFILFEPSHPKSSLVFSFGADVCILVSELGGRLQFSSPQLVDCAAHVEPVILDRASHVVFVFLHWSCGWYSLICFRAIPLMSGLEQHIKFVFSPSNHRCVTQLAARCSCSCPPALKVHFRVLVRLFLCWTYLTLCWWAFVLSVVSRSCQLSLSLPMEACGSDPRNYPVMMLTSSETSMWIICN